MAVVIILDQRNSSGNPDRVGPFLDCLNKTYADALKLPFERTAGDEMQAVLQTPSSLAGILGRAFEDGAWWAGVGLGPIDRYGASARESAGPAFKSARMAVEAAKRDRSSPGPVAVRGVPDEQAIRLQAGLGALAFIIGKRTSRQNEVIEAVRHADSQQAAATKLAVSAQSVSKSLVTAGYDEQTQLGNLITGLVQEVIDE